MLGFMGAIYRRMFGVEPSGWIRGGLAYVDPSFEIQPGQVIRLDGAPGEAIEVLQSPRTEIRTVLRKCEYCGRLVLPPAERKFETDQCQGCGAPLTVLVEVGDKENPNV